MANAASKLAIGGSVILVLLMMFSAISISAEELNDDPEYEVINVNNSGEIEGCTHNYDWTWDKETFTLTLSEEMHVVKISIYNNDEMASATVIIHGDVYFDHSGSDLQIDGNFNEAKIMGDGKLVFTNSPYDLHYYGEGALTIDGISLDLGGCAITSKSNLIIQNCLLVKVDNSMCCINSVDGYIKVVNSNLDLINGTPDFVLMSSYAGIDMPFEPAGDGLVYDNGKWVSGVTKTISGTEQGGSHLTMESYVPSSGSSVNMYDVSLYSVAAVSVVLILVGSIYAGKH